MKMVNDYGDIGSYNSIFFDGSSIGVDSNSDNNNISINICIMELVN